MTPLEVDMQLQCAELVFRSILEGKRLGVHQASDLDEWYNEVLGDVWVQQNSKQRREVARQVRVSGENTPEWMESVSNMGDIAWEVFETNGHGEVLRKLKDVDRAEVIEQFKELYPRVRDSHYARCGAGDRLYGVRACIAVLRLFLDDPEVLDWTASCLKWIIHDVEYNRNGLAELSLPMPPEDRSQDSKERGWAFLRAAFDAYLVQLGEQPHRWKPEDTNVAQEKSPQDEDSSDTDEGEKAKEAAPQIDRTPRRAVALKIAECIVGVRSAPAAMVQLRLLSERLPADAQVERRELVEMMPRVQAMTERLLSEEQAATGEGQAVLSDLLAMVGLARPGPGSAPVAVEEEELGEGDPAAGESGWSVLGGLAQGAHGPLGRGSAA